MFRKVAIVNSLGTPPVARPQTSAGGPGWAGLGGDTDNCILYAGREVKRMWWKRKPQEEPLVSEEEVIKLLRVVDERPYSASTVARLTPMIAYLFFRETRRLNASTDILLWVTVLLFLATLTLLWIAILLIGRIH